EVEQATLPRPPGTLKLVVHASRLLEPAGGTPAPHLKGCSKPEAVFAVPRSDAVDRFCCGTNGRTGAVDGRTDAAGSGRAAGRSGAAAVGRRRAGGGGAKQSQWQDRLQGDPQGGRGRAGAAVGGAVLV